MEPNETPDTPLLSKENISIPQKIKISLPEPVWIVCPACKQEKSFIEHGETVCIECREKDATRLLRIKLLKQILDCEDLSPYQLKELKRYQGNTDAINAAQMFCPEFDNILFYGANGTGKTTLARAIVCRWVLQGYTAKAMTASVLRDKFMNTSGSEISRDQRYGQYSRFDILLIDDLCRDNCNTPFFVEIFCAIMDKRKDRNKNGLLLTANMNLEHLAQYYGCDSVTSRINGMCDLRKVMPYDGNSRLVDFRDKREEVKDYKSAASGEK